ncbi:MAG: 4-hydroxy-tetrahydrodipicolinate reductase [Chitinophagaceae bacterium]|nr:4-hydroxy-tetrahydrodipicolinate reductase [Chitinophagaceae bacterium]MBK7680454.1 4-hydroxy-tetrahydrodipicolinate reductase [Chitinophagaceae bacterium]MBK8300750.1 4-hydroxy-tetrahydrodipicolinate reductase [Chitinophagaceae bacterium]MBK9661048.1 4-hydroxy-tetrahydrodipicolinate reductase [Chitinophagaceae bacterium]
MRIALIGYGKMGRAIEEVALQRGHEIVIKIDQSNLHEFTKENFAIAEAAIEFTSPHSALENVKKCLDFGIPVVCGSTGWTDRLEEMKKICADKNGSFIYSSNYSVGVNIFFEINKKLAALMAPHKEYEVILEETHHTQKKDAPSGTAITLAEQILEQVKRKKQWVNELSDHPEDLEIISQRVDPAPGTHSVKYSSAIDTIEIIHTAHNRKGFASGAVLAAEFAKDNKGFFTMKEVLNL